MYIHINKHKKVKLCPLIVTFFMAHIPKLLDEFNYESKGEDNEKKKLGRTP